MNGYFRTVAILLVSTLMITTHATAVTITGVTAPDLTRPVDGVLYPFNIFVSGTYTAADIALGAAIALNVEYWDDDALADDEIDLTGPLAVPAPGAVPAGTAWGPIAVALDVGCRTGPEVFGPDGGTGEAPMANGYFYITEGAGLLLISYGSWGYQTVTCTGTTPGTGTQRTMQLVDVGADCPLPGDPSVPCSRIHRVPEPSSLALVAGGIALLLGNGRIRQRRESGTVPFSAFGNRVRTPH